MNRFGGCQVGRGDDRVFADPASRAGVLPCSANLLKTADHVGSEAPFAGGWCVENQVAVPAVEGHEPFVDHRRCRLQVAIYVPLLPEPFWCDGDAGNSRQVALLRNLLASVLLERLDIRIVEAT